MTKELQNNENNIVGVENPKFKVGDNVRILAGLAKGSVSSIVCQDGSWFRVNFEEAPEGVWYRSSEIEPYTEID